MADVLKTKAASAGQDHLFHFFDTLSSADQLTFLAQVEKIDFDRVNRIYQRSVDAEKTLQAAHRDETISPLPEEAFESVINAKQKEEAFYATGLKAIAEGKVGVLLMAGGQGTRLGSTAPKGCYDIGLPSHKSLFQLQAERIQRLQVLATETHGRKEASVIIPWYIMTSGPTRRDTEAFFKTNGFFGLKAENVVFFEQGTLPCLTMEGKIILDAPGKIAEAPDGNGGLYAALRTPLSGSNSGTVLSDMEKRGITSIHTYGVDNCLVRIADPTFIGYGLTKGADCAVKVVRKVAPTEAVGVVAMRGHSYSVVEYSEISKEQAEERDPKSGELAFRAANIVNHFYTIDFLKKVESFEDEMPFHIARKKIPYLDLETKEVVKPSKPNGMKLELFVFDVFPFSKTFAVMEVDRKEEFSPLKNAPGTGSDDPDTSRRDILSQHRRFLENAGIKVKEDAVIELSPLVTYGGEGLTQCSGMTLTRAGYVSSIQGLDALR